MSAVVQIADRAGLLANWPLLADSTYSAPLPHTCHCVFWMAGLETEPYPALPGQKRPLKKLLHSGHSLCPYNCRLIRRLASDNLLVMQNLTDDPIVSVLLAITRALLSLSNHWAS